MTGTIKVDTAKLRQTAATFNFTGMNVSRATRAMCQDVYGLTGCIWSGEAASKYVNKFRSLEDDIQRMSRMISEHVNDLQVMAAEYEGAENANIEISDTLTEDVIF